MSITPPLAGMLGDPLLQERYLRHIEKLIELSGAEIERTRWLPEFQPLAAALPPVFKSARDVFVDRYQRNLLERVPQVPGRRGARDHHLRRDARLPAAHAGQPELVARPGDPDRRARLRAPLRPPAARHLAAGVRLRAGRRGDPPRGGHPLLLHRHARDPARNASAEVRRLRARSSPRPASPPSGATSNRRSRSGARRRGIRATTTTASSIATSAGTSSTTTSGRTCTPTAIARTWGSSTSGSPDRATRRSRTTSTGRARRRPSTRANFLFNRERQVEHLRDLLGRPPIIVAPYDAELFGHWWFEGPQWIEFLLRKIAFDQKTVATITPSEYLERLPDQSGRPPLDVLVGIQGLRRGLAQRLERLDLSPPSHGGRANGASSRTDSATRRAATACAIARYGRPRASCCSRRAATGPSS